MSAQVKGTGISIAVHALFFSLFFFVSTYQPVARKVIALDFHLIDSYQPVTSKGEVKAAAPEKVKAVKPKPVKKEVVKEEVKPVDMPEDEPVFPEEVVKEDSPPAEVTAEETEPVEKEPVAETLNAEANSTEDNNAASVAASKERYLKEHFLYIKKAIEKEIVYPRVARKRGLEGKCVVAFVICKDGNVADVRIVESSGHAILDNSAVATVKRAAPFPTPPVTAELVLPITYRLG